MDKVTKIISEHLHKRFDKFYLSAGGGVCFASPSSTSKAHVPNVILRNLLGSYKFNRELGCMELDEELLVKKVEDEFMHACVLKNHTEEVTILMNLLGVKVGDLTVDDLVHVQLRYKDREQKNEATMKLVVVAAAARKAGCIAG